MATVFLLIVSAGLASQWLAAQVRLPAIVVLIAVGLVLGPLTGTIQLGIPAAELTEMIGLGVAIILFEGGMDLKAGEFKREKHGIQRLTLLAPPVAWLLGGAAAHYLAGLSWPVSWVLGAILVVTGPTVILPLLRQARLNKDTASLLKWEGIINDPVGVLLAVLTFQYFTLSGGGLAQVALGMGSAIAAAVVLGGLGGWATGWLYRRGLIPAHLKAPLLMMLVLVCYWASNRIQNEAGLLSVTLMGMVIGNMQLVERDTLRRFQENLTVVLLSILFIVIPSQLELAQLARLDWRVGLFLLALLFVVRPVSVWLATIAAPIQPQERLLLAWIAPRGIVAAASAGIFGPALVNAGYQDGELLVPLVFLVIIVTVLAHGLTLGRLAQHLGLAAKTENGLLIVGASSWSMALAQALRKLKIDAIVSDGSYNRLKPLRMDGINVFYGEILSEHAHHTLDVEHLSHLLCATDNDYYNALVCQAQGDEFGHHRTFQLPSHLEAGGGNKQLPLQQRGYSAFSPAATLEQLHQWLHSGWKLQTTALTHALDYQTLQAELGTEGQDWQMIGGVSPRGSFWLSSSEKAFRPDPGWTLLYFAPPAEARNNWSHSDSAAAATDGKHSGAEKGTPHSTPTTPTTVDTVDTVDKGSRNSKCAQVDRNTASHYFAQQERHLDRVAACWRLCDFAFVFAKRALARRTPMTRKILTAFAATATLAFLSLGAVPPAQAATYATVVVSTGVHAPAHPTYQPVYQPVYQPGYRPGYRPHAEAVPRARPGHVWVAGHWQHAGPRALWQPGHWERSRAAAHRPHYKAPHHKGHYSQPQSSRRDRDGDGVPNRHDRRPNNPYRY